MSFQHSRLALLIAASVTLVMAGCSSSDNPTPTGSAPSTTLSASATDVARGKTGTLTWSSENADSCVASGDWSGAKGTSGTAEFGPARKDASYTLTCSGGGQTDAKTVAITATAVVQPTTYTGFPVTLNPASYDLGDHTTSVSYAGQMARHVLREQAKQTMGAPTTSGYDVIAEVENYLKNTDNVIDDTAIIAPTTKNEFIIKETINNEMGTGKNLYGKLFNAEGNGDPISGVETADAAKTLGVPGEKTAKEVVDLWVGYFGADNAGQVDGEADHYDLEQGYDYRQLLPKYLMGAVFYNESVNHYLDENLEPGVKDNDLPYKDGGHYTGKEHSWDEGFGWFGAAAHYGELTAGDNYEVAKKGKNKTQAEALALADKDGDGKVSLYTEFNSGPAYYAASFDRDGNSSYGKDTMDAWLEGRTIIANAVDDDGNARKLNDTERNSLKTLGSTIQRNWEAVFAEAVFKYAGESFEEIEKLENGTTTSPKKYYTVWSEMKGFMLSLQYGGTNSKITKAKFEEIDNLIGFGPVQPDGDQVNGLEAGEFAESYTYSTGNSLADYKAKMLQVQTKLDAFYTLKAKQHDNRS